MGRDQEWAGVEDQHAEAAVADDMVGEVAAEHPGTDDHHVERRTTVVHGLVPCVADEAAHQVERERRPLDIGDRQRLEGVVQAI